LNYTKHEFKEFGFSTLFSDYCAQKKEILSFFEFNPFQSDSLTQRDQRCSPSKPGRLESALRAYNPDVILHDNARKNIQALIDDPDARTIVTGQQLVLAGGPLFTLYKILTTISLANQYSKESGKTVVPVFWLADEDQDFEEIASITVQSGNEPRTFTMNPPDVESQRAGFIPVNDQVLGALDELIETLPDTEFHGQMSNLLQEAYQSGGTHGDAFGSLILKLFGRFGLIVFGSARPEARELLKDSFSMLIQKTDQIHTALEHESSKVELRYHRQVSVSESNWFMTSPDGSRFKLSYSNKRWRTHSGQEYTEGELIDLVQNNPNILSPNVFMRPILQDLLLPNIAIVAGPGEVAYYAQMRGLYNACEMIMPVVVPRFSAMIIEPPIQKSLSELPFVVSEYGQRQEDLETQFIQRTQDRNYDAFFDNWIQELTSLSDSKLEVIESVDLTLVGTLKRVQTEQINALNQLRGKLFKAIKSRQDVQIKRIHKIQLHLFPGRELQERSIGFIYMLNKYGEGLLDHLLDVISNNKTDGFYLIEV
jgi:bacillithiol biosynthesis cysteine-adding enzyme BshC